MFKVDLVFNFPTVMLNLIMTILPEMQLQSHCIFQIKIPIYEHLLMVYCRANSSSVGCWISDHTNVPWGCKDFFHDAVTKYI